MTPGPYLHIGGDEVEALTHAQYATFIERVQDIVAQVRQDDDRLGGDRAGAAAPDVDRAAVAERHRAARACGRGAKLILSPGAAGVPRHEVHAVAPSSGLRWAGFIELRTAYDWDPATYLPGVTEPSVLGVEAPLWTETVAEHHRRAVPARCRACRRSPRSGGAPRRRADWEGFRTRIAAHAPRWRLLGINYYPSPQVDW